MTRGSRDFLLFFSPLRACARDGVSYDRCMRRDKKKPNLNRRKVEDDIVLT